MTKQINEFKPIRSRSPNSWVYHFTSFPIAFEKILSTQTIRLGPLDTVNDPKESRLDGFFVKTNKGTTEKAQHEFAKSIRNYLRSHIKVFCATQDSFTGADVQKDRSLRQACFKPAMWAHYGGLHRGVCLVFDRLKLEAAILNDASSNTPIFGNVEYRQDLFDNCYAIDEEEFANGNGKAANVATDRFVNNYRELLLSKHLDWQYESEWRAFDLREKPGATYVPYKNALAAIVVGMDIPSVYFDLIRGIAWEHGISAYHVTWTISQWGAANLMNTPIKYEPNETQKLLKKIHESNA